MVVHPPRCLRIPTLLGESQISYFFGCHESLRVFLNVLGGGFGGFSAENYCYGWLLQSYNVGTPCRDSGQGFKKWPLRESHFLNSYFLNCGGGCNFIELQWSWCPHAKLVICLPQWPCRFAILLSLTKLAASFQEFGPNGGQQFALHKIHALSKSTFLPGSWKTLICSPSRPRNIIQHGAEVENTIWGQSRT